MRKYILSGLSAMALVLLAGSPVLASSHWDFVSRDTSYLRNRVEVESNTGRNQQGSMSMLLHGDDGDWGRVRSINELTTVGADSLGDVQNSVNDGDVMMPDDEDQDALYTRRSNLRNSVMVGANTGSNGQHAMSSLIVEDDGDGGRTTSRNTMRTGSAISTGSVWNVVNASYTPME